MAIARRKLKEENVDFVCAVEGPSTIVKTFNSLKNKTLNYSNIPDLWWRDEGRIIPSDSRAPLITDLDKEMPGIALDLMEMSNSQAHNWHAFEHLHDRSYASIHTSLGCPYKCSFYCINSPFGKPSYRMWSPEKVVAEIDYLVRNHNIKILRSLTRCLFTINATSMAYVTL